VNLTKNYRILTSKNEINNKFACNLLIRTAKVDELAFTGNLLLMRQISLSSLKKIEKGEIGSLDSLLRVLRTLGKLNVLQPLVEEE